MRIFLIIVVALSVSAVILFTIFGVEGIEFAQKIAIPNVRTIEISSLESADEDQLIWAVDVLNKQNKNPFPCQRAWKRQTKGEHLHGYVRNNFHPGQSPHPGRDR